MLNRQIKVFNDIIDYSLIYSDRKTAALCVLPSGVIILKSPKNISDDRLNNFIKKKYMWIKKQVKEVNKYKQAEKNDALMSGSSVLYCGRQYMIKVHEYQIIQKVVLEKGLLNIYSHCSKDNSEHNKLVLDSWYEDRMKIIFNQELKKMSNVFGYETPPLVIRKMQKRWGSCSTGGTVTLNPELIKASKNCISYVIAHELCHLRYKNHDTNFYNFLSAKFPNWESAKEKLELRFV